MDENRDYGGHRGQGGTTAEDVMQEVGDMGDMVQRDRHHPSIMIWSFCNEVGCDNETAAHFFRNISYFYDGTRGVTQVRAPPPQTWTIIQQDGPIPYAGPSTPSPPQAIHHRGAGL